MVKLPLPSAARRLLHSRFWRDESGLSGTEYGLMLAGFACVILAALSLVGTRVGDTFNHLATVLQSN